MSKRRFFIYAKVNDIGSYRYEINDSVDRQENDYVPYNIGIGGGDYIELEIDVEAGKIIGWDPEKFLKNFVDDNGS